MSDDFAQNTTTTGYVAVDGTVTGEIESSSDRDWFAVELEAGRTYVIDLEGSQTGNGTLTDPYLHGVYDADGRRLSGTENDDGGAGYNSRVFFTPSDAGIYYVAAGAYGSRTGTYTLSVSAVQDDHLAGTGTTGTVAVGGTATGEIETPRDHDWFAVELVAGATYVIDLEGVDSGGGTLDSTVLRGVYDAGGQFIAGTRTGRGGEGDDARLVFTATETGTHYIAARGSGQATGTYTVRLDVQEDGGLEDARQEQDAGTAPVFAQSSYAFDLAENADGALFGIGVGPVAATDPDNDGITYSIVGGDPDGLFVIDAETGFVVYVGTGEDYESGPTSYELTVRASDGALHSDVTVTVNVTDVEEHVILEQVANEAPVFGQASYEFSLAENTDGSTSRVSLGVVAASDADDDAVEYSIASGNASGLFEIDAETGELFYVGSGEDYEAGATRFDLTIRASDGTQSTDTTVTVAISDVAEQTIVEPTVPETQQSVSEPAGGDLPTNTSTSGRVVAGDGPVTGTIGRSGDRDGFAVELVEGRTYVIDLRGSPTSDGTLRDPYLRGIKGPDGGRIAGVSDDDGGTGYNSRLEFTPEETGTYYIIAGAYSSRQGTYELEVTDISPQAQQQETVNTAPAFGQASYEFPLVENADGSVNRISLGAVAAADPDNDTIEYSIAAGNPSGLFEIDAGTGELFYVGAGEDYEAGATQFDLTIRASDGSLHSDVSVAVNLADVEEYVILEQVANAAPEFGQASYAFDLAENADGSTNRVALGTVVAADPDDDAVEYSIAAGNPSNLFEIDAQTGELFYIGSGEDYEAIATPFDLTIRASDGVLHSDVTVSVNVTNVEETDPGQPGLQQTASEPDGEDFSADPTTAGYVAVGGTATGDIGSSGDLDWFAVDLVAGSTYVVDLRGGPTDDGTLWDPYLRGIHDADGNLVSGTTNDDGGRERNSRVIFTASENATYYIAAGAYSGQGTYELAVTETAIDETAVDGGDHPADSSTTGRVAIGGSETGEIQHVGDRDWFAVELQEGMTYVINLRGSATNDGTLSDPELRLYSPPPSWWGDGESLWFMGPLAVEAIDRDGGEDRNSQLTYTARASGTYYIEAYAGRYGSTGTYELEVMDVSTSDEDDFAASAETTGTVEVGGTATGEIEYANDQDWFAVELEEGETYTIDVRGISTGDSTLDHLYLHGIYDSNGSLISDTSDRIAGRGYAGYNDNIQVTFAPAQSGTYYLAAGTRLPRVGTYEVSVRADDFAASIETTGTVAVGGSAMGEIEDVRDHDWFAVELEAGKTYQIDVLGALSDGGTLPSPFTELHGVYDADGNIQGGVGDPIRIVPTWEILSLVTHERIQVHEGEDTQVFFTPSEDGTYYLAASTGSLSDTGTYTVRVTEIEDDFPKTVETTGTVEVGGSATGEIQYEGDRDWFAVELEAGQTYKVELLGGRSITGGTLVNPYIRGIHDADGRLISDTTDYASGPNSDSEVLFTPDADGTYYVAAGSYLSGLRDEDVGTYTVQVTIDDFRADNETTGTIEVGDSVTGEIESQGDRDWFAVTLEAGKTYQIDMEGSPTGAGTLANPFLFTMRDADGDVLRFLDQFGAWWVNTWTSDQDSGEGLNSRVTFAPDEDGTYYIVAGSGGHLYADDSHGRSLGTYTLSVEELVDAI